MFDFFKQTKKKFSLFLKRRKIELNYDRIADRIGDAFVGIYWIKTFIIILFFSVKTRTFLSFFDTAQDTIVVSTSFPNESIYLYYYLLLLLLFSLFTIHHQNINISFQRERNENCETSSCKYLSGP